MNIAQRRAGDGDQNLALTSDLAKWVANFKTKDVSANALTWAKHAMLDVIGVTVAGAREPLSEMLLEECAGGGDAPCSIIGHPRRANLLDAVLINGATAHALDYDDVNRRMHGHPSVPTAPVALALGEVLGLGGREVLAAFIAGTEVECLLGEMAGDGHYDHGYHATGTMGTFGAAATAAQLMGLDVGRTTHALGIAASQASGLKINFGTMTKPLHAGKAAMNGLLAARIAARGFTARETAIEGAQGFISTQAPGFKPAVVRPDPSRLLGIEETLFKYHAACYLTHSTIEAIKELRQKHKIGLADMDAITLLVADGHRKVCDIPEPVSGLEIKFSIRHLACMALDGVNTASLDIYSDANAHEARYVAGRKRVTLESKPAEQDRMAARVKVRLKDGRTLEAEANVGIPAKDLGRQWEALTSKFNAIAAPILGAAKSAALVEAIAGLDTAPDLKGLTRHLA
ncbi:MAG: MmgE/PrpD family protein [Hyphomicrobiaceae bacterium]